MTVVELQANVFKAMAHPARIKILVLLGNEKQCVCDIARMIDEPQPLVSRSLNALKQAGLVEAKKNGTKACYRLKSPEVVKMLESTTNIIRKQNADLVQVLQQKNTGGKNG